jgi:hypothetical protein
MSAIADDQKRWATAARARCSGRESVGSDSRTSAAARRACSRSRVSKPSLEPRHVRQAALAGAEEVAGPAQLQVLLREEETVGRLDHEVETGLAIERRLVGQQEAV